MTAWSSTVGGADSSSEHSALINAVRVVRERWWLMAVTGVVCFVVILVLSLHAQKQYTATSEVLVKPSNLPAVISPSQAQPTDSTTLGRIQSDDASLVTSTTIGAAVKSMLNSRESVADLLDEVQANVNSSNDLIAISVVDPSPARAAAKANAFATALVNYLTQSAQAQLVSGQAKLQSELAKLSPTNPSRTALQQGLEQVVALEAVTNGGVQTVQQATPPTSPSSPRVKRNAIIGLAVGILLGLALAFLLDLFDRRIKSAEELERLYTLPALTSVPLGRRAAGERQPHVDLEPFRILRDALGYVSLRERARVILVTSAVSGEGKTWAASGLARAMAIAGRSTVLIEADVHRPALKRELGLRSDRRGLMNVLVEERNPVDLVQPTSVLPSLSVLSSGPFTPNSAELLRLPAMGRVLDELAEAFDFVVIDGPPLLPVADAQVLLQNPAIDVVLIVARPYLTTREHIRATKALLRRHPEKGFGLVINAVRERTGYYYDSYHGRSDDDGLVIGDGVLPESVGATVGARSSHVRRVPRRPKADELDPSADPRSEPN
ncbi:MAG TPA: polysaccharide biosynthesis tyrosine autokinase [Solirubrobacteraceae bacterium]|nr:polysaccharide biosynthesis tyrosine autokinase [Solirubrobacteraceae bacterium]